ncbi:MAG: hypothetical protein NTU60_00485 [Candidatus Aminicenantes bacterium]|nr:hypothetical protein [Candidatus Aminicenantes bacterium]
MGEQDKDVFNAAQRFRVGTFVSLVSLSSPVFIYVHGTTRVVLPVSSQ